jgi:hypothetical protein
VEVLITLEAWDPLAAKAIDQSTENDAKKRQIENLLQSYTGYYDVFSELIQNALDAVDVRASKKEDGYFPTLWIDLDLKENSVRVTDNGIGFTKDQFTTFLTPNITFKGKKTRGNKGVGATYLAYGFNHLEIGTKTPAFSCYARIVGGREWVFGKYGSGRPSVQPIPTPQGTLDNVDIGATFLVKFTGENIRPKDLSWLQATTADQWSAILRSKTPLGGIYLDGQTTSKAKCILSVRDTKDQLTTANIKKCEYLYPNTVLQNTAKVTEIQKAQAEAATKAKDIWKEIPPQFRSLDGIYDVWTANDILTGDSLRPQLDDAEKELIKTLDLSLYGFFTYSVKVWKSINETKYNIRQGQEILSGGLQLATASMPQGNLITIPLTKAIGHQKTSHVIAHVMNASPDYGRKGFQPEVEALAKKLSVTVVNYISRWYPLLKKDSGSEIDIDASRKLHDWISTQEAFATANPLQITNENFFLPLKKISVLSKPQREQDVVVLFNHLIAGGVIRGIRIMSTSQHDQYDGLSRIVIEPPLENHKYHPDTNPLGINTIGISPVESEPWVLEYKLNLDALLHEFAIETKVEKDIKLVVCWEAGSEWKQNYKITSLLLPENVHLRPFHGATHKVTQVMTGANAFHMVVLRDLVGHLNDPKVSAETQREWYGSD